MKKPRGESLKLTYSVDITGKSSGRVTWVKPVVYQSTRSCPSIDSAALNLYAAYQHIEPEIKLVTRDPSFSPTGKLKNVPIDLDDFDVFFMGGRIQF